MKRLPRKVKKELKQLYLHRYGISWLKCDDLLINYLWFFKNPFKWDMNKSLKTNKNNDRFRKISSS